MRPRTSTRIPNRETMIQQYRLNTESMTVYVVPAMSVCPCCNKRRSSAQFVEGSRFCANCRRPRS